MRALYTFLVYLALPFLPLRLLWRGRHEPEYRRRIGERYGRYTGSVPSPLLWLHAVSLGETRAAVPLVERIERVYPDTAILLTHMTATGREAGAALFGKRVLQAWLPYDTPAAMRAFLAHFQPRAGLILETELWPNLVASARDAGVPLYLVNARMSERSAAGYARVSALARTMLETLSGVAAQAPSDAARLSKLGARDVVVTGSIKFDVDVTDAALALGRELRRRFGASRPVWVAGSTRDGEEDLILDALAAQPLPQNALTVIVPRHPQRFGAVSEILRTRGIPFVSRSANTDVPGGVSVVLGDSIGEMLAYYAAADVVFVGGGLEPLGGQNLIESIAAGRPTIVGAHMFNFAEATESALAAGAVLQVEDAGALIATVAALLLDADRREALGNAALAFHAAHRGATNRLWNWLSPRLDAPGISRAARG